MSTVLDHHSLYEARVSIDVFAQRVMNLAVLAGFVPGSGIPVSISMMGPNADWVQSAYTGAANRKFIISEAQPMVPPGSDPMIWFNPSTLTFYKSGNWKTIPTNTWDRVTVFLDLFVEFNLDTAATGGQNNSGLNGGVAQVPVILLGPPSSNNEAATKEYVDLLIAGMASGSGSVMYGLPVQSIADLKAIDVSGLPDKHMRLVEDAHKIFSYDLQGTQIPDNEYVVVPNVGVGRWIATTPNVLDGGSV